MSSAAIVTQATVLPTLVFQKNLPGKSFIDSTESVKLFSVQLANTKHMYRFDIDLNLRRQSSSFKL